MGVLQAHLINTISLNKARKPIYAALSSGKSLPLSRNLILATRSILPFAKRLDKQGTQLNRKGIPILREDLIPLQNLPKPETAPQYNRVIPKQEAYHLKMYVKHFAREMKFLCKERQLREVCLFSYNMLAQIEAWEDDYSCHFAMTKHVLSSMAHSALKGISYLEYEDQSMVLTSKLIHGHLFLLPWGIPFDRKAQHIQSMGVGFLVNDLPEVPFVDEWKRTKTKSWAR